MIRPVERGIAAPIAILVIAVILIVGIGAFYLGQNSVKIIGSNTSTTTMTLQTTQTVRTTQSVQIAQTTQTIQSTQIVLTTQTILTTPVQTVISIDLFSINAPQGSATFQYNAIIRNAGETQINAGNLDLYFTDTTSGVVTSTGCVIISSVPAGQTFQCSGTISGSVNSGDNVTLKAVTQDGSSAATTVKATGFASPQITLTVATLYGGKTTVATQATNSSATYIAFALDNPGTTTSLTGLTLTGSGISAITTWQRASGIAIAFNPNDPYSVVVGESTSALTFYASNLSGSGQTIVKGQVYNYVMNFANGQSISGSLIAQ